MLVKSVLFFLVLGWSSSLFSQTYFNESGKLILYSEYEDKILNKAYFGIPADDQGNFKLVYRMPEGVTDARMIYEKLGLQQEFSAGKPLIVIYYPGKDEWNSTGLGNTPGGLRKSVKTVARYAENHNAIPPLYIYKNPHGLEKYQGIQEWKPDPDQLFEKLFFPYPYPCGSFVVISPKGNFKGILGEYPLSQIDVALRKL